MVCGLPSPPGFQCPAGSATRAEALLNGSSHALNKFRPAYLAGRRHGEVAHYDERLGQFVIGHAALQKRHDFIERQAGTRFDDGTQAVLLTEPRIGRADDRRLHDRRVLVEQLLDLAGKVLLAAAVDDLLVASSDAPVTFLVRILAEFTGREPAF